MSFVQAARRFPSRTFAREEKESRTPEENLGHYSFRIARNSCNSGEPQGHYEPALPETAAYEQRAGFLGILSDFDLFSELRFTTAMFLGVGVDAAARTACEACSGEVSIFLSGPGYLEIVGCGVSKATGLRAWLARCNLVPAEVMAFGDAESFEKIREPGTSARHGRGRACSARCWP